MAALVAFLLLVVAPLIWGHSLFWFFPVMFIGFPVTLALMREPKPDRWSPGVLVVGDEAETQKNLAAAIARWEQPRRSRPSAPLLPQL